MNIKLSDIINKIEEVYPHSLAFDWDNPGLICGRSDKTINTVLIALDADNKTVKRAVKENADLLLTHHPMIFGSVKKVNDESVPGRKLLDLIENKTACYAMHTNFDIAAGGMGDQVAKRLGVEAVAPLEITADDAVKPLGIGFTGECDKEKGISTEKLIKRIKAGFNIKTLWCYDAGRPIKKIAVCPGSGRGMLDEVIKSGADAFITGDTGHHDGLDYLDENITLIDAGHFGLEHIFTDVMEEFLKEHFPKLNIIKELTDERKFV